jgi:hypothetical protein
MPTQRKGRAGTMVGNGRGSPMQLDGTIVVTPATARGVGPRGRQRGDQAALV